MGKEKFFYNTSTLRYEKVEVTLKEKLIRVFGFLCAVVVTGVFATLLIWQFFPSPREEMLLRENQQLQNVVADLDNNFDRLSLVLENLRERDASVHRLMFGMDPIDDNVWAGGIGGHEKYADLSNLPESGDMLSTTMARVDRLKRQLSLQSVSLDTIITMAKDREQMLSSIPSIKPVRSDKLARNIKLLSGFGYRIHPIHKVRKMHAGIDFTAPTGTAIQSTGDGKVVRVDRKRTGYGHHVVVDHGYGYKTLYGHMSQIDVKVGQKVTKGQQIGLVGSTGTSTAPHLHYEVHYKGDKVNPIHYCMDGLSPEEYQELVGLADVANQSFD